MHGSYKTEAVVLRSLRLGEADRVLHLYTPARGRVGAVAKGVRRTRSRVGARLEPFSHVALVLHEGRGELHTISGVDTLATHHAVREQPERARIAGACRRGAAQDVRRGRSVAARLRRALPAARGARRLRRGRRATSRSIRCCWPSSSSCTGWPDSRRGSRPARPAAAEGVPLVRFSAAAGGAVCGACPGGDPAAAGRRSRRSSALLRAPLAEVPALPRRSPRSSPAAPPISTPSTAASACARSR